MPGSSGSAWRRGGRRGPGAAAPRLPRVGRADLPDDQDPAVRLALQRRPAGRELRRLQPLRLGPRGHPGRPLEARRSRTTTSSGRTRPCGSASASRSRPPTSRATPTAEERIQREPSHYTISMPFTVRLDQPLEDDRHFVLFVASCPVSAKATRNFTWNARNYDLDPARDQGFVDFQQVILEQDRVVVESPAPRGAADRPVRGAPHQGRRPGVDRLPPLARRDRGRALGREVRPRARASRPGATPGALSWR